MNTSKVAPHPLVSIIIPCYNHGVYLADAINSVKQQDYPSIEIIVVDDGSTDQTKAVALSFAGIKYVYQTNQGLSAARNKGISCSLGQYLVFLDADDWLLPDAIKINVELLQADAQVAFVSGGHDKIYVIRGVTITYAQEVGSNHYEYFLRGNYIGMPGAVMYRRWAFDELSYDSSLEACEDYDVYLKIARVHRVVHHTKRVGAYRIHGSNMSSNSTMMLRAALLVLRGQRSLLITAAERRAYACGIKAWRRLYCPAIYENLKVADRKASFEEVMMLARFSPLLVMKLILYPSAMAMKAILKK